MSGDEAHDPETCTECQMRRCLHCGAAGIDCRCFSYEPEAGCWEYVEAQAKEPTQ